MQMKKFLLATGGLLALLGMAGPASAADMRVKAPPPVAPPVMLYNWTGFYIGGHVGGAWVDHDVFDPLIGLGVSLDKSGFLGGGQVGFNYQPLGSNWVFGVEGDIAWVDIDNNHICPAVAFNCNHNHNWLATVTGRLGYAWDTVFLYAKGGAAFVNHEFTGPNAFGILVSESNTRTGWTVGARRRWSRMGLCAELVGEGRIQLHGLQQRHPRFPQPRNADQRGQSRCQLPLWLGPSGRTEILTSPCYVSQVNLGRQKCRPISLRLLHDSACTTVIWPWRDFGRRAAVA
jgi:outer membrane immunogenic protein